MIVFIHDVWLQTWQSGRWWCCWIPYEQAQEWGKNLTFLEIQLPTSYAFRQSPKHFWLPSSKHWWVHFHTTINKSLKLNEHYIAGKHQKQTIKHPWTCQNTDCKMPTIRLNTLKCTLWVQRIIFMFVRHFNFPSTCCVLFPWHSSCFIWCPVMLEKEAPKTWLAGNTETAKWYQMANNLLWLTVC